ncbi:extensin isoform X2 [Drosophila subobscura]|uniref:extensin isoform X2 n=1 Tax=Drosophila subobscura TaxID=7241 RepID=UPI00155A2EA8|nr:extensin isoform X2 [Drosophila subobscura]
MTRSSVSVSVSILFAIICLEWIGIRTCDAQFAFTSAGSAVASAGGLTVVAQLPGFGALNGVLNGFNHNNNFYAQQQQQQGGGGWPGMGMGGRRPPPAPNAGRQPAPPGWPPGWEWGGNGNYNQPGFNNGRGPPQRPGWGGGPGGMGPPQRPGWGGGPGGGMGPPRPNWAGGGMGPPRPGWGGGGMNNAWGDGEGPPPGSGWENNGNGNGNGNNQPNPTDQYTNWENPSGEGSSTPPPVIVTPPTTPKPVSVGPTFQPRPPPATTKSTLIVGTNRPPLLPPQPTARPSPKPSLHSIEDSQLRDIIFPSSARYIHRPPSQELRADSIDERR